MRFEVWNDLPPILADSNQIKQVLVNLIQNALQAMPYGGSLVLSTASQTVNEEKWITISVSDTGEGIPPENLERVFDPFFTTRPIGKGTGLGLSVSYGLVADHGGYIDLNSEVGVGSCFKVWLPIEKVKIESHA
jgi:signal transduction histidine kinase